MLPVEIRALLHNEHHFSALEAWVEEIRNRWSVAPELDVNTERLGHLALICDGNRRAAQKRGVYPSFLAHFPGVETVLAIDRVARRSWGIPICTYWLWSTENWARGVDQINFINQLARLYLKSKRLYGELVEDDIKVVHLGSKLGLPEDISEALSGLEEKTKEAKGHIINLAINYGGREEIAQAVIKIALDINSHKLKAQEILENPTLVMNYLYTAGQRLPDLVIRTGMTQDELVRTNWFLPLQTGEARYKFLPEMFPELTPEILADALKHFLRYSARRGV